MVLEDWMLASGWGKAWVGEDGAVDMMCKGMLSFSAQWTWAKLGGGIGDDAVSYEMPCSRLRLGASVVLIRLGRVVVGSIETHPVSGAVAGLPAALDVLGNVSSSLTDITTEETAKAGDQAGILDRESGGVATDAEEFQAILLPRTWKLG